jgi:hypothetical protein
MIELRRDDLVFRFPEVHRDAEFRVHFQRTLRIPDDDREYPLPAGLGELPLRHVDDFADGVPEGWIERGGVMLPMYQSEAMWINFSGHYPFAVKIAAGKINAVTGESWDDVLHRDPQDYVALPEQPWLDGYCVEKGVIRQFVAMPLGSGYSVEEQLTGKAEYGGLQILAYPMKREAWEKHRRAQRYDRSMPASAVLCCTGAAPAMALAPGGRMRQEIYDDPYDFGEWDQRHSSRCYVHIANSLVWRSITGQAPPTTPLTAKEYGKAMIPWFDYYSEDGTAVNGADKLKWLKSVAQMARKKGDVPLPDNEPIDVDAVVQLRKGRKKGQVREGRF